MLSVPSAYCSILILILIWAVIPIEIIRKMFPEAEQKTVSREELVALADIGESEGAIEEDEEKVIRNLLKLHETLVSEVMTPGIVMTAVNTLDRRQGSFGNPIMIHGPLIIGESSDDVLGIVLRSDILRKAAADEDDILMSELMRPVTFCSGDQSVDAALDILISANKS